MSRTGIGWGVLLVIGALGLGYGLIRQPAQAPARSTAAPSARLPVHSDPLAAPAGEPRPVRTPSEAAGTAADSTPATAPPSPAVPARTAPPAYLKAETALLAEADGHQGLDVRAVTDLTRGDRFSNFMDRLADEAASSSLALDLTELYAQSAAEANAAGGDQLTVRLVCGMTVCAVSATAPSKDVFDAWFELFITNPAAVPYGLGRHDKVTANGTLEHRIVFSTDQQRQHVIMPGR